MNPAMEDLSPHSPFLSTLLSGGRSPAERDPRWPRVTIVIPSFNQGRYLEQTILSVLNQDYPNLELIIMDGGSTDNSVAIILKYEQHLAHWKSQPDEGQAAAIADGFRMASGDVLAYLNSDDLYLPGTLRSVGEFFRAASGADLFYGDCLVISDDNCIIRRIYPIDFDLDTFLYDHVIIQQQAAFWSRDLYSKVGEMDRTLRFCMDYELLLRFALSGARFTRTERILAAFRSHPESKTSRQRAIHDEEYFRIFQRAKGRPLGRRDIPTIAFHRLKRYWREPRGLFESIKSRFSHLRSA